MPTSEEEYQDLPDIALQWIEGRRNPPNWMDARCRFGFLLNSQWTKILKVFEIGLTKDEICQLLAWKGKSLSKDEFDYVMAMPEIKRWFHPYIDTNGKYRYVWKDDRRKLVSKSGSKGEVERESRHTYLSEEWGLKDRHFSEDIGYILASNGTIDKEIARILYKKQNIPVLIGVFEVVEQVLTNFRKSTDEISKGYILDKSQGDNLNKILGDLDKLIGTDKKKGDIRKQIEFVRTLENIPIEERIQLPQLKTVTLHVLTFSFYFIPKAIRIMAESSIFSED